LPVLDANIAVDWVWPGLDPKRPAIDLLDLLVGGDEDLIAPPLLISEACNALLTGVRAGGLTGAEADASQRLIPDLPIVIDDDARDIDRAWWLARRFDNHPFYDLIYVALAERRGMSLITNDRKLRSRLMDLDFILAPEDLT
jgi:predicted nucleic acid-binding protein